VAGRNHSLIKHGVHLKYGIQTQKCGVQIQNKKSMESVFLQVTIDKKILIFLWTRMSRITQASKILTD